jgi:hypothetical protein
MDRRRKFDFLDAAAATAAAAAACSAAEVVSTPMAVPTATRALAVTAWHNKKVKNMWKIGLCDFS